MEFPEMDSVAVEEGAGGGMFSSPVFSRTVPVDALGSLAETRSAAENEAQIHN